MSDIINVGLQQGGITESAPKAIDQKGYELLTIFMTEEDRQTVADSYELITKDHEAYTNYLEDYPKLEEEDIYVLKSDHDEELNTIFSTAMMSFTSLSEEMMFLHIIKYHLFFTILGDFCDIIKMVVKCKRHLKHWMSR